MTAFDAATEARVSDLVLGDRRHGLPADVTDARFWDEMYDSREQIFSGNPNPVLVTEISGLTPGRALDVGCGEGADAVWLAGQGWQVTGVDIARTAIDRAARRDSRVTWVHADWTVTPPHAEAFDLVTVHFVPIPRRHARNLIDAVAPGGTLLVTGHDLSDLPAGHIPGFDPADYVEPAALAEQLGDGWTVLVDEKRRRAPDATPHTHDRVLRATRDPI
ncbi:SAM-dependent methyltransferase [Actinoplanes lutulentus]|uniref:Methyltransferase family protein n=1 Tax=Actinoplanes lutulentus TaxID=1287878 RepID=A0A327Z6E1_9ACTN|nr:class I SAM-dependent methyltransferase [Actinoplanes lutulentus]MBB2948243.1 SAM-dependent methyltransferase [Actinoplanes lutulentus]RAK31259.1 methyltransferase family protein [Actinoplanes lutulentus]